MKLPHVSTKSLIKKFIFLPTALCMAVLIILLPSFKIVEAAEWRSGQKQTVASAETIQNDLYIVSKTISSKGNINGDLTVAGGTVEIAGNISDNINAVGKTISISSAVGKSIRAAGGEVSIMGTVANDVIVLGNEVDIESTRIGRDVVVTGGSVFINSPINGDVSVKAQEITLGSNAVINGDFTYSADSEVVMESGAKVNGKTVFNQNKNSHDENGAKEWMGGLLLSWLIIKIVSLVAATFILGLIFAKFMKGMAGDVFVSPYKEMGRGAGVFFATPFILLIVAITGIGFQLALIGFGLYIISLLLATVVATVVVGSKLYALFTKSSTYEVNWKTVLLGCFAFYVLTLVPFFGFIIQMLLVFMALGLIFKKFFRMLDGLRS